MKDRPTSNQKSVKADCHISDIPNAWDEEYAPNTVSQNPTKANSEHLDMHHKELTKADINECKNDNDANAIVSHFTDDNLNNVEPASKEEISRKSRKKDEDDLDEHFYAHAKAAEMSEKEFRRRKFEIDQKMDCVDFSIKQRYRVYASPFLEEILNVMSDHLEEDKATIFEAAILMFYSRCFSIERKMLADMGILLDGSTLQNKELEIEVSGLVDLANEAIRAEMIPPTCSSNTDLISQAQMS